MRTRLERLLGIEHEIRAGRYPSLDRLCYMFSVKPRTIYEDIRILRERLGLDIQFDRLRNGYFNASPAKKLPSFDLSKEELLLILIGGEILCSSLGAKLKPIINQIHQKIGERIPDAEIALVDNIRNKIQSERTKHEPIEAFILFNILEACLQQVAIEVIHSFGGGNSTEIIEPIKLLERAKQWEIFGRFRDRGETDSLPLRFITDCRLLKEPIAPHDHMDYRCINFGCLL